MNPVWQENEPLAAHTTLKIGGSARYFVKVTTEAELAAVASSACHRGEPILVIGGGSNLLVDDAGFAGVVIENCITGVSESAVDQDSVELSVGAGTVFDELVAHTVERGYWGLENLSHIPGSVGATPIQNVGAYGVEVSQLVTNVRAFDKVRETFVNFDTAACQFEYRNSFFKSDAGRKFIVTNVTFRLQRQPTLNITYKDIAAYFQNKPNPTQADIRNAVIEIRSHKFPDWKKVGTAGSFFKNPFISNLHFAKLREQYAELPGYPSNGDLVKVPLGWVLDNVCQLRGYREGNVGLYANQALVLINYGGATAAEVKTFAQTIAAKVFDATEIEIEWEVTSV